MTIAGYGMDSNNNIKMLTYVQVTGLYWMMRILLYISVAVTVSSSWICPFSSRIANYWYNAYIYTAVFLFQ